MHLVMAARIHRPFDAAGPELAAAADELAELAELLAAHPHLPVALRVSEPVLAWVEGHRPELLAALREAGDRVEWLGGGWAEPILPMLPHPDRARQLDREMAALSGRFTARVRGVWPAPDGWEPSLAGTLAAASVEFVLLAEPGEAPPPHPAGGGRRSRGDGGGGAGAPCRRPGVHPG